MGNFHQKNQARKSALPEFCMRLTLWCLVRAVTLALREFRL